MSAVRESVLDARLRSVTCHHRVRLQRVGMDGIDESRHFVSRGSLLPTWQGLLTLTTRQ